MYLHGGAQLSALSRISYSDLNNAIEYIVGLSDTAKNTRIIITNLDFIELDTVLTCAFFIVHCILTGTDQNFYHFKITSFCFIGKAI